MGGIHDKSQFWQTLNEHFVAQSNYMRTVHKHNHTEKIVHTAQETSLCVRAKDRQILVCDELFANSLRTMWFASVYTSLSIVIIYYTDCNVLTTVYSTKFVPICRIVFLPSVLLCCRLINGLHAFIICFFGKTKVI